MQDIYQVIKSPMRTEKGNLLIEAGQSVIVLKVNPHANKCEIKAAVEKLFKVRVDVVRTAKFLGKFKRMGRSRGKRPDWKKAYVTLKAGEKLPEFIAQA
ncbi:MAG: 50S ribosomal protein L23 [Acidobacteria bacterium]|nr:50S ribosomal protein L23 [Acidobacteriota bacterium]MBI3657619.1 50S ribosomal protein L23 [Acidobacteriota bacterium]